MKCPRGKRTYGTYFTRSEALMTGVSSMEIMSKYRVRLTYTDGTTEVAFMPKFIAELPDWKGDYSNTFQDLNPFDVVSRVQATRDNDWIEAGSEKQFEKVWQA